MVVELKLRKIGNSVGVVLPKEVLAHLKVGEGDTICVTESVDGSLRMLPSNDEFKKQMETAKSIAHRYRRALRELAK